MSEALAQRMLALAAAALLAGVFGVALSQAGREPSAAALPEPAVGSWGGWTQARAGVSPSPPARGRRQGCDWLVRRRTEGVVHPTLPCGARVYLDYGSRLVLTQVVARFPVGQGRQLDLTPGLASRLRLEGVRELRWAFTR
ncbi:MAG TPA: hypothetical protein VFR32_00305 [Gaiellaceae bacterium]|nr:hypothetical protein [Gaiellaceae bacterium]